MVNTYFTITAAQPISTCLPMASHVPIAAALPTRLMHFGGFPCHRFRARNMVEQGFTYKLKEWWSVDAAYRYTRTDLNATGIFSSVTGTTVASGTSLNQWRIGTSQADLTMMFTPISSLLFDVGVRYLKSDVLALDNSVADPLETQRISRWANAQSQLRSVEEVLYSRRCWGDQ